MVLTSETLARPAQPAEPEHKGPKVSVFILSYNKGAYVLDAMRSVLNQTMPSWELWILENSNDGITHKLVEEELERWRYGARFGPASTVKYERLEGEEIEAKRRETYVACWLLNVYYPEARGKYIFCLSDDDLIDPDCLEVMAAELDANPGHRVVYASLRTAVPTGPGDFGPWPDIGIPALDPKMFPGSVDCRIDGGQVMYHKTCLDALSFPYFEENPQGSVARHSDGLFLERLVGRFPFWPIPKYLITHRWTPVSVWSKQV
jgi:glycosyltransferase involved in cell wall biosynthesis